MRGIWAIARQTLAQCLRMKVGVAFIVLLGVALAVTPLLTSQGQAPLADRIRAFFSYSTYAVMTLLACLTVFLAAGAITGDVRQKQVFLVVSKPLARWQYILGRWLGIVLLDAVLLAVASTAIYAYAQYLRQGAELNPSDRRAVETEVFTARHRIAPDPVPGLDQAVEERVADLRQKGQWDSAVESMLPRVGGDRREAEQMAWREIRKSLLQGMQSIAPGRTKRWTFSGIHPAGEPIEHQGQVREVREDHRQLVVATDRAVLRQLMIGGPVLVDGVSGNVVVVGDAEFLIEFAPDDAAGHVALLARGSSVTVKVEPMIQLTYKAIAGMAPPSGNLRSQWLVDSMSGFVRVVPRSDAPDVPATITLPSRLVGPTGNMSVRYANLPDGDFATSVTIRDGDLWVLYQVDSFTANYARGMSQVLLAMAFLAALALLAGSFLSFAVACLACFAVLPFALIRGFLDEAIGSDGGPLSRGLMYVMSVLMPDLERLSPSEALVGGMNVEWGDLATHACWALGAAAAALALACLIFHRRELARVQV